MTSPSLPYPDQSSQPLEFLDAMLDPADLLPGTLIALIVDDEGRGCVNVVSDGGPAPLPAAHADFLEPFVTLAGELRGHLGLILCRTGLPGVTLADRAWAELLGERCAREAIDSLGVLVHTPDGTMRAG